MDLNTLWFTLIGVLFTGFFFLEGFDFGVGMLLNFVGRNDNEKRHVINSIGTFWDGNEVWMLTAGGAIFAAFPHWYATLFSGFYIALVLMLVALILRGVSFEFRSKNKAPAWRKTWDALLGIGSFLTALLWGVAVGNLLRGVPINADMQYTGTFFTLLNPFSLLTGVLFVLAFCLHGALFLSLRTDGDLKARAEAAARLLWLPTTLIAVAFLIYGIFQTNLFPARQPLAWIVSVAPAIPLLLAGLFILKKGYGKAFAGTGLTIALLVAAVFTSMFPNVMISSTLPEFSLTIYNASSTPYTLKVMTIVALIFVPIVLCYQAWSYWIFRQRLRSDSPLEY